ncbi:DUF3868 domain-containing protein [Bacteroides sp. 519]|uniref:DUF3868 domain-containing protein n=1 Tax=Bacteroides sp. 519 TaxID=2302937 RepID=UPI0013D5AC06|nr:DUF3868 domain-containing protein [Bacteroides sp. 519]NDV58283.1 DUF3868 domain-containing protein [Bacteroides sp. 519]
MKKNKLRGYGIVTQNSLLKTHYFIAFITFISFSTFVAAQQYHGSALVESLDFCERNDSLLIRFSIQIESNVVPSCGSVLFIPEIRQKGRIFELPYIQVNGAARSKANRRWFAVTSKGWLANYEAPYLLVNTNKYINDQFFYTLKLPFESWMNEGSLYIRQEVVGCRAQVNMYTYKLNDQLKLAPREPYVAQPLVSLVTPAEEFKTRNRQGSAYLDFQVGSSVILPDFRRNPVELSKIDDALLEVMSDEDSQITELFIEGYASPEGKYASNEKLARERSMALKEYIRSSYMLSEKIFTVRSVAEDWDGLRAVVDGSDFSQKKQILNIIDSADDYDRKEARLKDLPVYYRLLKDVFPELRRVEYQINYAVRNYTTAEARILANSNPENLSQAELYRVAMEYGKGSNEYKRIVIEVIPKYHDNDPVALNNAAALLIENNELSTALRLLEKVPTLPAAWNNKGVVYMMRGELDKAIEMLNQAKVAGVQEAAHNLQEVDKLGIKN